MPTSSSWWTFTIRRDMKTDPAAMTERLGTMIHGDLRRALCRLASNRGGTARDED